MGVYSFIAIEAASKLKSTSERPQTLCEPKGTWAIVLCNFNVPRLRAPFQARRDEDANGIVSVAGLPTSRRILEGVCGYDSSFSFVS